MELGVIHKSAKDALLNLLLTRKDVCYKNYNNTYVFGNLK